MTTDWIFIVALGGLAVLLLALVPRGRHNKRHNLDQAAQDCARLLRLLALLQQHRGVSAAWLTGERSFADRQRSLQAEIDALWPSLLDIARRENTQSRPCFSVNDWALFQFRWGKLSEGLAGMSAADAIHAHSQLITRLLDWLAALGEARIAGTAQANISRSLVSDYVHRLPALTECLGQARALGASVAAAGQCSPVARVRLGFLVSRAESLLLATRRAERPRTGDAAQRAVEDLLAMVRRHLLGAHVSIGAQDYFVAATRAIDAVFAWIASHGEGLREATGDAEPARPGAMHEATA